MTPGLSQLSSSGHHLLMTKFGPLDLLGTIGSGRSYEDFLQHTAELEVTNLRVAVLDLKTLIEAKKETVSEKGKAIITILERSLGEKLK